MKGLLFFTFILSVVMLILPLPALRQNDGFYLPVSQNPAESVTASKSYPSLTQDDPSNENSQPADNTQVLEPVKEFKILNRSTGKVDKVSMQDYVRGALAAEMPATFHLEAMKAQAVAAHTYALNLKRQNENGTDSTLKGADFSADPQNWLGYVTEDLARERFGDNFEVYWNKICKAADSVMQYVLVYEEQPIVAAYHAISAGQTEDAANVWLTGVPYLVPVESQGDQLAPGYESAVTFTQAQIKEKLSKAYPESNFSADPAAWFGNIQRSESGYITSVTACGVQMHGKELRELLGLRSSNMEITYANGQFTIVVKGYGHGVGLSQYGADYMARQGDSFDIILSHYYPGTQLAQIGAE